MGFLESTNIVPFIGVEALSLEWSKTHNHRFHLGLELFSLSSSDLDGIYPALLLQQRSVPFQVNTFPSQYSILIVKKGCWELFAKELVGFLHKYVEAEQIILLHSIDSNIHTSGQVHHTTITDKAAHSKHQKVPSIFGEDEMVHILWKEFSLAYDVQSSSTSIDLLSIACVEGDNRHDAEILLQSILGTEAGKGLEIESVKEPDSWQFVFGPSFSSHIYQ